MPLPAVGTVYAHYEADSLAFANGATVTTWPDLSGNALDLAQTGGAALPTCETNSLNGMRGVKFTGAQRIAKTSGVAAPATKTIIFVAFNPPNDGTVKYITEPPTDLIAKWSNANRWIFGNSDTNFLEFTEAGIVGTAGIWTFALLGNSSQVRWNQVQKVSGNLSAPVADNAIVLSSVANTGTGFILYEYVIYNGTLSGADITTVETYLFNKWFVAPSPPLAPANPAAVAVSTSQIDVSWSDVADETGFRVERSLTGVGGWSNVSGSLGVGVTSFSNTGLSASTQYFYRVFAFNAVGDSPASTTVNATTQAAPSSGGNRMGTGRAIRKSPSMGSR